MVLFHRTWYYYGTIVLPVFLDMSEMVHVKKKKLAKQWYMSKQNGITKNKCDFTFVNSPQTW